MENIDDNFKSLRTVLDKAFARASSPNQKGMQRHGNDALPFEQQEIVQEILRMDSFAGHVYQIRKKALELLRLSPEQKQKELLDIIVYACAMYIVVDSKYVKCEILQPADRVLLCRTHKIMFLDGSVCPGNYINIDEPSKCPEGTSCYHCVKHHGGYVACPYNGD